MQIMNQHYKLNAISVIVPVTRWLPVVILHWLLTYLLTKMADISELFCSSIGQPVSWSKQLSNGKAVYLIMCNLSLFADSVLF